MNEPDANGVPIPSGSKYLLPGSMDPNKERTVGSIWDCPEPNYFNGIDPIWYNNRGKEYINDMDPRLDDDYGIL